jgi:hypothetical protein
VLYELWNSESGGSYALRYFPDIADYHVRPLDETVVWFTHAGSFEEAIHGQHDYLGWGSYSPHPQKWAYPPAKRTYLAVYDYGQGGIWIFIDSESTAQILNRYPGLSVVSHRPPWFTPEEQRRLASTSHFDIENPSGWLLEHGDDLR